MAANNIWTKEVILSLGCGEVYILPELFAGRNTAYRFTVQAYSFRPNIVQSLV